MNDNNDKQQIVSLYNKTMNLYDKVLTNRTKINKDLSDFVLGEQVGSEVYGYSNSTAIGTDVSLPQDTSVYDKTILEIQNDINDVNSLSGQCETVIRRLQTITLDDELVKIWDKVQSIFKDLKEQLVGRNDVLNRLKKIRELIIEQQEEFAKRKNEEVIGGQGSPGGGGGGGYGGGGSSPSSTSPTPSSTATQDDSTFTPDALTRPSVGDYTRTIPIPTIQDATSIPNTVTNLAQHEQAVGNILGHVVLNGVAIGSDVYPVGDLAMPDSDIGFDFMALQMALDYVDADIEATKAFIVQLNTEISNNEAKIAECKAKMEEYDEYPTHDDEGNWTGTYKVPRYDHAALQADIDDLTSKNEKLQKQIEEYSAKQTQKEGVFDELISVRNAYNKAYDGLVNVFTASSGLDAVSKMGADNSLYGVKLSDNQLRSMFTAMGTTLEENRGNISLKISGGADLTKGEFSLKNFDYLVSSCAGLGYGGKPFSDNLKHFLQYDNNRASTLNTKAGMSGGFQDDSGTSGDSAEKSEVADLDSTLTGIQSAISTSLADTKHIVVEAQVQTFLEENNGKTVAIPATIRQTLGLQTEGLLSVPTGYDVNKDYPFVYWLVGTGHAAGTPDHLKTASFAKSLANGKYQNNDALIYVPGRWGNGNSVNSLYNGSMLNHDLNQLVNGLNVDQNRISGTGTSIGAYALAYLVDKNPNLFSTVAFTGGGFEGPWGGNVPLADAISGSPNTTFIWYIANNDESSLNRRGEGVHTYTLDQHHRLLAAGINSVYYEIDGGIWHTNACDRFASNGLMYDLTHIVKGQKFNVPRDVQHVSAQTSFDGSIDHGDGSVDWYNSLLQV